MNNNRKERKGKETEVDNIHIIIKKYKYHILQIIYIKQIPKSIKIIFLNVPTQIRK